MSSKLIIADEHSLYQRAEVLEKNAALKKEIVRWDREFGQDGLEEDIFKPISTSENKD
jgi:hypothetical protein